MADSFVGEIRLFPYSASRIPTNWAICDGTALTIRQNQLLYAVIGNTYGGDGQNTFQLPDLQERAPMHPGTAPGLSPRRLGDKGGYEFVSLTTAQLPEHTHGTKVLHDRADLSDPSGAYPGFDDSPNVKVYATADSEKLVSMHQNSLEYAGEGGSHENRQPFLALHFCISLSGFFPPRS
ncbi:MAG: tail fiber protein [Victivallaceae bacterium]|nr:tail fiber protein [Victivallaceae bacterium]